VAKNKQMNEQYRTVNTCQAVSVNRIIWRFFDAYSLIIRSRYGRLTSSKCVTSIV